MKEAGCGAKIGVNVLDLDAGGYDETNGVRRGIAVCIRFDVSRLWPGSDRKSAPRAGDNTCGAVQSTGASNQSASAAAAFSKLGLKPELVAKAIPILTSFVTKSGGADVGQLLASVLK